MFGLDGGLESDSNACRHSGKAPRTRLPHFQGGGGTKTLQPSANEEPQHQYVATVATLSVMLT